MSSYKLSQFVTSFVMPEKIISFVQFGRFFLLMVTKKSVVLKLQNIKYTPFLHKNAL